MDDYTSSSGRKIDELTKEQVRAVRAQTRIRLQNQLDHAMVQASRVEADLAEPAGLNGTQRKCNRDWARKLNNMLLKGAGFGLSTFVPSRRLKALQPDEERVFIESALPD